MHDAGPHCSGMEVTEQGDNHPDDGGYQLNNLPTKLKSELMHKLDQGNIEAEKLQGLARELGLANEHCETIKETYDFISSLDNLTSSVRLCSLEKALKCIDQPELSEDIAKLYEDEKLSSPAPPTLTLSIPSPDPVLPNATVGAHSSPVVETPPILSMNLALLKSTRPHVHVVYFADAHLSKYRRHLQHQLRSNGFELSETKLRSRQMFNGSMWSAIHSRTFLTNPVDFVLICLTPCHYKLLHKMKSIFPSNDPATIKDMKKSVIGVLFSGKNSPIYQSKTRKYKPKSLYVSAAKTLVKRHLPLTYEGPTEYKSLFFYMIQRHKDLKKDNPTNTTNIQQEAVSPNTDGPMGPPTPLTNIELQSMMDQSSSPGCHATGYELQFPTTPLPSGTHVNRCQAITTSVPQLQVAIVEPTMVQRRESESSFSTLTTDAASSGSELSTEIEEFDAQSPQSTIFDGQSLDFTGFDDEDTMGFGGCLDIRNIGTPKPL